MSTQYPTAQDPPVRADANTRYDADWFNHVEERFDKLGGEAVEQRNRPFVCCYPKADPGGSAIALGTVVALSGVNGPEPYMVPATSANLDAGARILGVLTQTTPAGSRGRVATAGIVPVDLTGYVGGAAFIGADPTTGKVIAVTSGESSALVGVAGPDKSLVLSPNASPIRPGLATIVLAGGTASYAPTVGEYTRRVIRLTGSPAAGCVVSPAYFEGAEWLIENGTGVSIDWHTSGNVSIASGTSKLLVHRGVLKTIATVT